MRRSRKLPLGTVIFDGDDTLWRSQEFYDEAKRQFRKLMMGAGYSGKNAITLLEEIDASNVGIMGFSRKRFPESMVQTYHVLAGEKGEKIDRAIEREARTLGRTVFRRKPSWLPAARETLAKLSRCYQIVLFTAGDPQVQRRKIRSLDATAFVHKVKIVPMKTPEAFRALLEELRISAGNTVMVGNSLRSDILPALAVGVSPVWVLSKSWRYDRTRMRPKDLPATRTLHRIPSLVRKLTRKK